MHNAMKTLIFILALFFCLPVQGQKNTESTTKNKAAVDSVYIPTDLNDCFKQLDSMFADSIKSKIKVLTEDEFVGKYHFGFGMWMRNNWGLWKGSILSKYFNSIGIYHPDDMTGIIFDSYHRQLTGQAIRLTEQVKYYQDYWEKAKKQNLERKQEEYSSYKIGDTVFFNYRNDFVSKAQEDKYDNDICTAKGLIVARDEEKFFIKVKLLDGCDKKGIISYDNEGTLVYNTTTKKMEKPKRRIVTYMKVGEENWFNYSDWATND